MLTLEGEPLSFSRLPLVLDGDVYVPAEELARAIGWASAEQPDGTLFLWGERRQARLSEGRSLLSGGSSVSLDCPVIRANGVLMAPVKALCQALDLPCEQGEAGLDLRTSADTWDWVQKLDQSCRQHGITLEQAVGGLPLTVWSAGSARRSGGSPPSWTCFSGPQAGSRSQRARRHRLRARRSYNGHKIFTQSHRFFQRLGVHCT